MVPSLGTLCMRSLLSKAPFEIHKSLPTVGIAGPYTCGNTCPTMYKRLDILRSMKRMLCGDPLITKGIDGLLQSVILALAPSALLDVLGDLSPSLAAIFVGSPSQLRGDTVPVTQASLAH